MKKAQMWSIELTVTISIFFVALAIFGAMVLSGNTSSKTLVADAEKTVQFVTSNTNNSFMDNGNLNKSKAANLNYTDLKRGLGLKSDVCIYFEDKDGRLIQLSGKNAVGDANISVNGVPCTEN